MFSNPFETQRPCWHSFSTPIVWDITKRDCNSITIDDGIMEDHFRTQRESVRTRYTEPFSVEGRIAACHQRKQNLTVVEIKTPQPQQKKRKSETTAGGRSIQIRTLSKKKDQIPSKLVITMENMFNIII